MNVFWVMFGLMLAVMSLGAWFLLAPLDTLWERQKRLLLSRGQTPQRTPEWEETTRRGAVMVIVIGGLAAFIIAALYFYTPPRLSGVTINGRALTQQEWDACGHDMPTCLNKEHTNTSFH